MAQFPNPLPRSPGPSGRHVLLSLLALSVLAGCGPSAERVSYVIPEGATGEIYTGDVVPIPEPPSTPPPSGGGPVRPPAPPPEAPPEEPPPQEPPPPPPGPVPPPALGYKIASLALQPHLLRLVGGDRGRGNVVEIDPDTQQRTDLMPRGGLRIEGMAAAPSGMVYASETDGGTLMVLDPEMNVLMAHEMGTHGIRALAYDERDDTLYGVDSDSGCLVVIDKDTGLVQPIAKLTEYARIEALAFDRETGLLLGVDLPSRSLIAIDGHTGETGLVKVLDLEAVRGLSPAREPGLIMAADNATGLVERVEPRPEPPPPPEQD